MIVMKPTQNTKESREARRDNGFALVITLLLLVLLSLLCVGMLSLSSISLRTSVGDSDMSRARSNARMALMLAIGRLQDQMGSDQRVSANGGILSDSTVNHPHWTGVWDSWKAGPTASGDDQPSDHRTIPGAPGARNGMSPSYEEGREDHFRSWLVSLEPAEASEMSSAVSLALNGVGMPDNTDTAVRLVGEGSLAEGNTAGFVSARLLPVRSSPGKGLGRYAWWVGDESQKASILADPYNSGPSLTDSDHIFRSQAPGTMGTQVIQGLQNATNEEQLDRLPSLKTLDLVDVDPAPAAGEATVSQQNFHDVTTYNLGVLADVREGGLKRDLSTILEQPINLEDDGDEYMLYRFDEDGEDRVPIQDLAAYYQLYQNDPGWSSGKRGGIEHNANPSRVIQVKTPDLGNAGNRGKFTREYTSLYRSAVPIRVQFVLGVGATEITDSERTAILARGVPLRTNDKYKMLLGVKPVVSLWNPNNTPLVMGTDASQIMKVGFPPFTLRWKKYRPDGSPAEYQSQYLNLNYSISNESTGDGRARSLGPYIMQLQFARNSPIVFEPGEVKMFSIPIAASNFLETGGNSTFGNTPLYQAEEFLPDGFYVTAKTVVQSSGSDAVQFPNSSGSFVGYQGWRMVYGDGDKIDFEVAPEAQTPRARAVSNANEVRGSGFQFWMSDADYATNSQTAHFRNYQFISRFGGTDNPGSSPNFAFNSDLMRSGFPGGADIPYQGQTNALPGSAIKSATDNGEAKGLLLFTMMSGAELHNANSPGAGAGRRVTTRPFLHGSSMGAPQITDNTRAALYEYGWEWQVERINEVEEAFQDDGAGRGYYGGGYTAGAGVTNVVQQYLPALPPISIASLSSARLGGFSLADAPVMATKTDNVTVGSPYDNGPFILRDAPGANDFRQVTATGQGGLAPNTLQAIGNSYAHPNIPADKAYTTYIQLLNMDTDVSNPPQRTYADHSYLANKALWDEFFFSSITPQPSDIPLYGGAAKTAEEVAEEFLFNDGSLPNRRFVPYTSNLSPDEFDDLAAKYTTYSNGFADKITCHLMLAGSFNINSTSVEAWKVFFSSLKGKPLAYLEDQASSLSTVTPDGSPVAPGTLANGVPIESGDLSQDPNAPPEQWTSPRSLSDDEIGQLASAMVEQVKKRGPFLSLSEFVNRRLEIDPSDSEAALKGALQAALDDDSVSINAAFRTPARSMDGEIGTMVAAFPDALKGPIAYGSTPYVDQADILRHLGSTITPRGDTFVIRTYGDALDPDGNVLARAWCEAVVQRLPEYVDNTDEPHLSHDSLTSPANKQYGRMFGIVRFRWLNSNEV